MIKSLLIILVALFLLACFIFFVAKNVLLSKTCNTEILFKANNPKNISYNIEGQNIILVNGLNEMNIDSDSQLKRITRYFGNEAYNDFNKDGVQDVAFLITQDNGGSGTFYYIVAAVSTSNGYQGTNGILLGDRIAPQTTEIHDGVIVVNYADRMEGEAMTDRPSLGVSKYFVIDNYILKEKL